jgi:hypothetical protein
LLLVICFGDNFLISLVGRKTMCLGPELLAAAGLMAGSTIANKKANKAVRKKQEGVSEAERIRQKGFQQQAQTTLDNTMQKFQVPSQTQAIADTATQRETSLQGTQAQPGDYAPTNNNEPTVVKSDIAQRMADAVAQGKREVMSRAKLGAYGQNQNQNAIALGRSGQDIGQMADFSRGSASVMPYEMNAALGAGNKYRSIADMMRMTGYGLGMYGMMQPAPLNYATSPSQVANVRSSLEEAYPMTYTDPNDLVQARKLGMIR